MTIMEAISQTDALKQNTYSNSHKVAWLSKVDGMVKRLIIDTHEGGEGVIFTGYTDDTPMDTELLVPAPFDTLYQRWLEAQIDLANAENEQYNASISLFTTEYHAFEDDYHRKHMPIGGSRFLF
jgi:hypothetical protein